MAEAIDYVRHKGCKLGCGTTFHAPTCMVAHGPEEAQVATKVEELRQALEVYGMHLSSCAFTRGMAGAKGCTCGFNEARR